MVKNKLNVLLLIHPINKKPIMERDKAVTDSFGTFLPIGLLDIASFLKKHRDEHVNIKIADCSLGVWDKSRFEDMLLDFKPDIAGITSYTPLVLDLKLSLESIKRILPDCITVIGGAHVTSFKEEALCYDEIDYAIMGDGELAFLQLFDALYMDKDYSDVSGLIYRDNGAIKCNEINDADLPSLDSIPHPDYTLVPYWEYRSPIGTQDIMISTITTRGCPFRCTFCNSPDKKYRKRSMQNVIEEIKYICSLGVKEVFFFDDLFNLKNDRVYELCSLLSHENIKITWAFKSRVENIDEELVKTVKAHGCERIHFGLEADDNDTLRALKKGITVEQIKKAVSICYKNRVNSVGSFMINLPGDTRQSILNRFEFANSLKLDYCQFAILVAYNHSEIFNQGVETGLWDKNLWLNYIKKPALDFEPPIWDNRIPRKELDKLLRNGLKKFYFRPQYVYQRLRNLHSMNELKKYVKGGIKVLKF